MKTLVLASGSPSRKEILEQYGYEFEVDVSNYEENMSLDMSPQKLAVTLSQGKAHDVAKRHKNSVILGGDSFAVFKGQLLGKPHTKERAKEMLTMLSGQAHSFISGFTVIDTDSNTEITGVSDKKVYFKRLTPEQIDDYLNKEDVLKKAGAYSSQGLGRQLIEKIEGDISNVRGLPMDKVAKVLKQFGIEPKHGRSQSDGR